MSKEEFETLSNPEQDEAVLNDGTYILNDNQGDLMCDVYKLYQFFVKFCYDLRVNVDPDITAFDMNEGFRLYQTNAFKASAKN